MHDNAPSHAATKCLSLIFGAKVNFRGKVDDFGGKVDDWAIVKKKVYVCGRQYANNYS